MVLEQDDIVAKREFPDGCVPSTWSIDLHYPKDEYAKKYPDNPFISKAVHDRRVDRTYGYPVPYRCFYSRNIDNLFMAGRNISVTHEALGTVRVMKTCGMMGEVVGKAASLCALHDCSPREVYEKHLDELLHLLELPGKARRSTPSAEITIDKGALPRAAAYGPIDGLDPAKLAGTVIDDKDASIKGSWQSGRTKRKYVGYGYRYANAGSGASATFNWKVEEAGTYRIGVRSAPFDNRAKDGPVELQVNGKSSEHRVNYQGSEEGEFVEVDTVKITAGAEIKVIVKTIAADQKKVSGLVHLDAVQFLKVD